MTHDIVIQICIAIVAATTGALIAKLLRQPVILGYIAAGILVGPTEGLGWIDAHQIEPISELGLILLLFMIGLEIDLKKLLASGKPLVASGTGQFIVCVALGLGFWSMLAGTLGGGTYAALYLAVACALSSTMIVVKLLYDKFELDTTAGRLSLGVLVFQDIWAILFLAVQRDLANPSVMTVVVSLAKGVLLVVFGLLFSRYVLPRLFRSVAKMPEMMVLGGLAWCFGVAMLASYLELSREMGALIAGIALSTFPYNLDVVSKVVSLRDFFITLFFVTLGAQIAQPNAEMLTYAVAGSLFVMASRLLSITPILQRTNAGIRASVITALNLSQISEFSLVICTIGVGLGHVTGEVLAVVVLMLVITSVLSTYIIQYNYEIFTWMHPWLRRMGVRDYEPVHQTATLEASADVVFLGFTRAASSLLHELLREDDSLSGRTVVIDFNPVVKEELDRRGIRAVYGDISHAGTLHHAGVEHAKVLISTVPDMLLRGTSNAKLFQQLQAMAPDAQIVVTADVFAEARRLYDLGAAFVYLPRLMSPRELASVIHDALAGNLAHRRHAANLDLERVEVLP